MTDVMVRVHIPWRRLAGSWALGGLVSLLSYRDGIDLTLVPVSLIVALVFYRAWPFLASRFPVLNQWNFTTGGLVSGVILSIAIPLGSMLLRNEPVTALALAPRVFGMFLGTLAIALIASVIHMERWPAK